MDRKWTAVLGVSTNIKVSALTVQRGEQDWLHVEESIKLAESTFFILVRFVEPCRDTDALGTTGVYRG